MDLIATRNVTLLKTLELDPTFLSEVKARSPETLIVGRVTLGQLDLNQADIRAEARRAVEAVLPLAMDARRVGLVDAWEGFNEPVPGDETLTSHRVDIGVFAHNGAHYSAPAFVSFTFPANEWREYDRAGRILHVDYHGSALGKRYIDPIIFPLRDWSDRYRYDDAGRLIGWTRTRSDGSTDFTRHGARVIETDNRGRPVRAAAVRYTLEPGPGNIARVVEAPTGHVLRYAYGSETDILGELEPALETYRKLTWSKWKDQAQQRIARMTETHLSLLTRRVFRTNEQVAVQLDTRNIDKLQVKLYRLDMEAYFRKAHTIRGVEDLDIALIDTDRTWEHEVPDYAAYKPIAGEVVIETDGPGVFAKLIRRIPTARGPATGRGRQSHRRMRSRSRLAGGFPASMAW